MSNKSEDSVVELKGIELEDHNSSDANIELKNHNLPNADNSKLEDHNSPDAEEDHNLLAEFIELDISNNEGPYTLLVNKSVFDSAEDSKNAIAKKCAIKKGSK